MKSNTKIISSIGVASVLALSASITLAQELIDVNFIDDSINVMWGGGAVPPPAAMTGAAVLGAAGDYWNGLGGFNYSAYPLGATYSSWQLYTAANGPSTVSLSLTAANGTYDANSVNWGNHSPFTTPVLTPWSPLMSTMLCSHTSNLVDTVTLYNLLPSSSYTLIVYNAGDANVGAGRTSTFTVNGVTQTAKWDGIQSTLINGTDYLMFNAVSDPTGMLVISYGNSANGDESDFNGFQIEGQFAVPEPSTLALVGAGMALLLGVQRRRNS